jgi:hypothetical protein
VAGVDGITSQEMEEVHMQSKNLKDCRNYIRAISWLCKRPGSRSTCVIHFIERLNRYYGIPPEFRDIYPRYKVANSFKFRICEYITAITEIIHNS